MELALINGEKHVAFQVPTDPTIDHDKYFRLADLDALYCLVLNQLRDDIKHKAAADSKLNIKRRRLLFNIRKAFKRYDNARKLPLAVTKRKMKNRTAKLYSYSILG